MELVATAQNIHQELDDSVHWCKGVREQDKSDDNRKFLVESKGFIERSVVNEDGEEGEDVEEVGLEKVNRGSSNRELKAYLRNSKQSRGVPETPMTKFMSQNSHNFLGLALLNQCVVDDNMLLPWHAEEVGIAMSASLTSVNDMELGKRKLQPLCKILNTSLQFPGFERRELVE